MSGGPSHQYVDRFAELVVEHPEALGPAGAVVWQQTGAVLGALEALLEALAERLERAALPGRRRRAHEHEHLRAGRDERLDAAHAPGAADLEHAVTRPPDGVGHRERRDAAWPGVVTGYALGMTSPSSTPEPFDITAPLLFLGSTPADWLGAIGGIVSLGIAVAAFVHSQRISTPRVRWSLRQEGGKAWLEQEGVEIEAVVTALEEVSEGNAVTIHTEAPRRIGHGASLLMHVSRSIADAYPTEVEVTWRDARPGRGPHGREQKRAFTLD